MLNTEYLTDEELKELEDWRKHWQNNDPEMMELKRLNRERIQTEINCKLSHTTVSKTGKVYHYPSKEVSFEQLSITNIYKYASEPDAVQQLDKEVDTLTRMKLYQQLDKAMASLSKEDREFITDLIVNGKPEREKAAELGTYQKKINRRKNAILRKLKKFF